MLHLCFQSWEPYEPWLKDRQQGEAHRVGDVGDFSFLRELYKLAGNLQDL